MTPDEDITNIGTGVPNNAVSLYGQDNGMDDFPVLKAFQQYIDAEQAKARKRMLMLCTFFIVLMTIVITVFVGLLFMVSSHNQDLNDRLIEFAMKERTAPSGSAVVVQPPQDNSAILKLTEKLNEMQKKLSESQQAVAAAEAKADEASKPKGPTAEEREIIRLKALLAAEKEQAALERERTHQAELEAYRRKHYPELYERPSVQVKKVTRRQKSEEDEEDDVQKDIDALLNDDKPISYYDDDEDVEDERPNNVKKSKPSPSTPPSQSSAEEKKPQAKAEKNYSIPVDIKGSSSNWNIPLD